MWSQMFVAASVQQKPLAVNNELKVITDNLGSIL